MSGMAPISLQQFVNPTTGAAYAGAKAAFYEASTNTPITVYSDYGLSTEHSNPVIADAYGRFPPIFIDEDVEFYRLRMTTASGAVLPLGDGGSFDIPMLPVIGPAASGDGGEVTVGTSDLSTGDVIWSPKTGTKTNFVRLNGRTIGSASSGATERANADTEDLYSFYWTNFSDTLAPVSTGRGISASSDFAANKTITLLDLRGGSPFGLDDMGGSAASAFTGITFAKGNATTGGASGGANTHTLTEAQLPAITPAGTVDLTNATSVHRSGSTQSSQAGEGSSIGPWFLSSTVFQHTISASFTGTPFGSGSAHPIINKFVLGTFYQRL